MSQEKRRKPTIGIVGWTFNDGKMYGVNKDYLYYFTTFGNVRMVSIYDENIQTDLDLLVLPGGADVDTTRYGQIPELTTSSPNIFLEAFDKFFLGKYIEAGVPIFGICRGLQSLNVHFGGTLYQEIGGGHQPEKRDTEPVHGLLFTDAYEAALSKLTNPKNGKSPLYVKGVTSRHHQAIDVLGEGLEIMAVASNSDWVAEVIVHEELNIAAVQYHPESNVEETDKFTPALIRILLDKSLQKWTKEWKGRTALSSMK